MVAKLHILRGLLQLFQMPAGLPNAPSSVCTAQVALYTSRRISDFASAAAAQLHTAQQELSLAPGDEALSHTVQRMGEILLQQPRDLRMEVLRQHPATLTADAYMDPAFVTANSHLFGSFTLLHTFAARHNGTLHVSAHCSAAAAMLAEHLPDVHAVNTLACEASVGDSTDAQLVTGNGALRTRQCWIREGHCATPHCRCRPQGRKQGAVLWLHSAQPRMVFRMWRCRM